MYTFKINRQNMNYTAISILLKSLELCSELTDPDNGKVNLTGLTNGSTATYTCDNGYKLSRNQTRTCLNTGVWSGQKPICFGMF